MMISDFLLLLPAVVGLWLLLWWRARKPRVAPLPPRSIIVDGSNVLHWAGGPSVLVLTRVLRELAQKGYTPIIYFDANVGYVLDDHYYDAGMLAGLLDLAERQICVVDKGVVADEAILKHAARHRLRIVTNDRFRDWRVRFPHAAKKGVLVGGTWRDGAVVWRGKL